MLLLLFVGGSLCVCLVSPTALISLTIIFFFRCVALILSYNAFTGRCIYTPGHVRFLEVIACRPIIKKIYMATARVILPLLPFSSIIIGSFAIHKNKILSSGLPEELYRHFRRQRPRPFGMPVLCVCFELHLICFFFRIAKWNLRNQSQFVMVKPKRNCRMNY